MDAALEVSQALYGAAAPFSYGSLRGTLFHIFEAEHFWRVLCQERRFAEELLEKDFATAAIIDERWREEEAAMRAYLSRLAGDDLSDIVRYTVDNGQRRERRLWHCLWHVVNHGTQHRSEAAAILTGYGSSPGDVDFTLFLNEHSPSAGPLPRKPF
jgi:uncharacterized damage-inducible protein DinB